MFRIGNPTIKIISLKVVRNFAIKSSIGHVVMSSEDFKQTVDAILMDSKDSQEKFIILQTLLSIASKSEKSKAKLKNSSFTRKLNEQLAIMQSDPQYSMKPENINVMHLTSMLSRLLSNTD